MPDYAWLASLSFRQASTNGGSSCGRRSIRRPSLAHRLACSIADEESSNNELDYDVSTAGGARTRYAIAELLLDPENTRTRSLVPTGAHETIVLVLVRYFDRCRVADLTTIPGLEWDTSYPVRVVVRRGSCNQWQTSAAASSVGDFHVMS